MVSHEISTYDCIDEAMLLVEHSMHRITQLMSDQDVNISYREQEKLLAFQELLWEGYCACDYVLSHSTNGQLRDLSSPAHCSA